MKINNERGSVEVIVEVIYLIAMFSIFALPFAFLQMWWWFFFVLSIVISFGVFEYFRHRATGKTLSSRYLLLRKDQPVAFWITTGCLVLFWTMLILHLGWDVPGRWF